jgi:hypothetical protein
MVTLDEGRSRGRCFAADITLVSSVGAMGVIRHVRFLVSEFDVIEMVGRPR